MDIPLHGISSTTSDPSPGSLQCSDGASSDWLYVHNVSASNIQEAIQCAKGTFHKFKVGKK